MMKVLGSHVVLHTHCKLVIQIHIDGAFLSSVIVMTVKVCAAGFFFLPFMVN